MSSRKRDEELLLLHVLQVDRTKLYTHPEIKLTAEQQKLFDTLYQRYNNGEPVAYILGHQPFWTLNLIVTRDTLIPRPETELLVELCLKKVPVKDATIADLGTGSGAIALAAASEKPGWKITAADQSKKALAVARENAQKHGIKNVEFVCSDWFEKLDKYHAIISNPPYIAQDDPHLKDLQSEPQSALVSGIDGLGAIKKIIKQAPKHLFDGGFLLLEHGFEQGSTVEKLFKEAGFKNIEQHHDLAGHWRVTLGKR